MSDCDGHKGFFSVPGVQSHWQTDYMAHYIDSERAKGTAAPEENNRLNELERQYHTAPTSIGGQLERAVVSGNADQIQAQVRNVDSLSRLDKVEAACTAQDLNDADARVNASLPRLEVVLEQGENGKSLKQIRMMKPIVSIIEGGSDRH